MPQRAWPLRGIGQLQGRLLLLVALAVVAVVGADGLNLLSAYRQAIVTAQSETANLSRSLAGQAHGAFQTMDTILVGLRERVETEGTAPASLDRLQHVLQLRSDALPMVHKLLVTDASGRVLVISGAALPAFPSIGTQRNFLHHVADPDRGSFLGWPVRDPVDGSWVVTVSRRWNRPDGSFGGIVGVSIATSFFASPYAGFDTGRHGVILLTRADGVNIARWPPDPRGEGFNVSGSELFTRIVGPGDRERFENYSQADRLVRLGSYHWVPGAPALVMVGRSRSDVLAGWHATAGLHALGLGTVLGALALLAGRLALKMGEEARAQEVLREANRRLAASQADTIRANGWLEMAEQIAQVGHWLVELSEADGPPLVVWSDEVYRIRGVEPQQSNLTLESAILSYHPDDRPVVAGAVQAAIRSGLPAEFTARLVRPDGSTRIVLSRGLPQSGPDGTVKAVFGVVMDVTEQKRSEAALRRAHAEAEAANQALEAANHALEALAMQDALTELANRRRFDRALELEFRRAARDAAALGLVLLDVDHFKQFNDIYGHLAGDACLRAIASIIPPLLNRPGDLAARYGGEELAVLLPGNTAGGALALACRIADGVRALAIPHGGSPHGIVTISAGVQAFEPVPERMRAADLVEQADTALYGAKRAGRDRVLIYRDTILLSASA